MSVDVSLVPKIEEIYIEVVQDEEIIIKEEIQIQNEATTNPNPVCNVCNFPFKFLRRHLLSHGNFNCMECMLNFPTESIYEQHLQIIHKVNPKSFICDSCQMGFPTLNDLAVHHFKHTGTYACPKCKFTVKGKHKQSLINHMKRHDGIFNFYCEICKQGFMNKSFLGSHMEMHEGIPKYECEFCKKKFTVKRYLEIHRTLNHKKELFGIDETFKCQVCGRNFSFEKSMVRHLSAIHKIGPDLTVECPVCQKRIANNHNLKKHMRTHTGEKRFCCDTCGKAFSEKKYLIQHQNAHERANQRDIQWKIETNAAWHEYSGSSNDSTYCTDLV